MTKVTIVDRDTKTPIDSYDTFKEGEEFEAELSAFKAEILKKFNIPFKWQEVITSETL